MPALDDKRVFRVACLCAVALLHVFTAHAFGQESPSREEGLSRRLYVEPFATSVGLEQLQGEVIAELRRLGSVSLASTETGADVILGAGGEIWIQGYRSLNPRSGSSPRNGTPVYGGFVAVELKDVRGETLWSDLATPGPDPGDIPRSLSKQIAKRVADALTQDAIPLPVNLPQPRARLKGAGATFPAPVYSKWLNNYRRVNPETEITYDAVGSEAGVRRLLSGDVDFGASDNPDAVHQLAPEQEGKYLLFPTVVGAVVPIVNLPEVAGEIGFTPDVLAAIYLGRIKKWNDPALRRTNPRLRLPDREILVVHRSDGSGTSYVWSDYLSRTSPEWKARVGASFDPPWPAGRGAAGNEGVASLVKDTGGSIGYVEFIYALQKHLSFGTVRNANGEYVGASLQSLGVAARQAMEISDSLNVSLADAPGPGAYPISSFTWLVVPAHITDETKRGAITAFLKWMIGPGQRQAAALGYLALPKEVISREEAAIGRIQ
jgi:phosphate transport system substrate-binding protein